jgi:hypothetical protein
LLALADQCNNVLGFCNDFLDDVAFLGSLGFGSESLAELADTMAEKIWFITCLFDTFFLLVDLRRLDSKLKRLFSGGVASKERRDEICRLKSKRFMLLLGLLKILSDLTISSSYAFDLPLSKKAIGCAGLVSGAASFYKLWQKAESIRQ